LLLTPLEACVLFSSWDEEVSFYRRASYLIPFLLEEKRLPLLLACDYYSAFDDPAFSPDSECFVVLVVSKYFR
jgi:hypothetical protein